METIKELEKGIEELNIDENRRIGKTTRSYFEFKIQTLKEVLELIDEMKLKNPLMDYWILNELKSEIEGK